MALTFLLTGQDIAAIDSLSIDPVSAWLQNLPTSWQVKVLTRYLTLDALYLLMFVLYLWYMVAVSLYIHDPRDITEAGGTSKILSVVQDM